jgi:hypothetical protein
MDITKFEDGDDPGFKAVAGELRRWLRELGRSKVSDNGMGQEHQEGHGADFVQGSTGDPSGRIQNRFKNTGTVANQAGQQIIHGGFTIKQSV